MKAICLRARGGPEALAYEEAPQPHPGEGEVLVRVHAAGVIHTELSWVPTWTTQAATGKSRRPAASMQAVALLPPERDRAGSTAPARGSSRFRKCWIA